MTTPNPAGLRQSVQAVDPFDEAETSRVALAREDIYNGFSRTWLWGDLALRDIKARYQGSVLGPFWLTLSTTILIAVIGFVYARLLQANPSQYLPYISIGIVIWQFVANTLNNGGDTFVGAASIIQQVRMPLSVHVLRQTSREVIALAHMAVIVPVVLLIFDKPVGWKALLAVPGLMVLIVNAFWLSALIGLVSARFRDIPQIITSATLILFFCTPVFWYPEAMGASSDLMVLNPIFAAIDVVRAPILGEAIRPTSWPILLATTACGLALAFLMFARFRSRIVFWI